MKAILTIILFFLYTIIKCQSFVGGVGDGYGVSTLTTTGHYFYGGTGDGYVESQLLNPIQFFTGGTGDGYHLRALDNIQSFYTGGSGDGYFSEEYLFYLIWTGSIGSGWNVAANWSENIIPDETLKVIIPANAITMPAVNAGNFIIGNDPTGTFRCNTLWVQSGANLLTRAQCFIINKSKITIDGTFRFRNQAINAFTNNGKISINNGGILQTEF